MNLYVFCNLSRWNEKLWHSICQQMIWSKEHNHFILYYICLVIEGFDFRVLNRVLIAAELQYCTIFHVLLQNSENSQSQQNFSNKLSEIRTIRQKSNWKPTIGYINKNFVTFNDYLLSHNVSIYEQFIHFYIGLYNSYCANYQ